MRKNHSKIVCIKLVHLPYLYIWCTVTLIINHQFGILCSYGKGLCTAIEGTRKLNTWGEHLIIWETEERHTKFLYKNTWKLLLLQVRMKTLTQTIWKWVVLMELELCPVLKLGISGGAILTSATTELGRS